MLIVVQLIEFRHLLGELASPFIWVRITKTLELVRQRFLGQDPVQSPGNPVRLSRIKLLVIIKRPAEFEYGNWDIM